MKTRVKHAESPIVQSYTLCHVTHEGRGKARMAKVGETVNCPTCRVGINFCRTFSEQYHAAR